MNETDAMIVAGDLLPKIVAAEKGNGPFDIIVTWASGSREGRTGVIDASPPILTFKVYKPLRDDPGLFARMKVSDDGTAIVWPGNANLEISADALEELADQSMTSMGFVDFIKSKGWTLETAAAQLGISRLQVAYYRKERSIPRLVALACQALRGVDPDR